MKIQVTAECALSGLCTSIAPGVFDVSGDVDVARVVVDEVTDPELVERVREAAANCPTGAIVLSD